MTEQPTPELERLREQTRVLAAGLGLDEAFAISDDVRRHAANGQKVQAVKALREQAPGRLSLLAAKRMVDALAQD